jgi:hypothetical protein
MTQGRPCVPHWRGAPWYGRLGAIVSRSLRSGPLDSGLGSHASQQSQVFPKGKHDDIHDSHQRNQLFKSAIPTGFGSALIANTTI